MRKRLLSILLALCVVFTLLPGTAWTADDDSIVYPVTGGYIKFNAATGTITDCSLAATDAVIPNRINDVAVTSIGNYAFYQCGSLASVTIPNKVTSIGERAFRFCSSLTSMTIPNSVTSIGHGAFDGCSSLTSVTIPNSVTSIGEHAFDGCRGLTNVIIPNSVTSIGDGTFQSCDGLTSVTIPNSVTSIGNSAFYWCSSLTSMAIPNSVISIGDWAFRFCSGLTSVTIPNSVTSIGKDAFNGCSNLGDVYFDGSESQWNQISIGSENDPLLNADIHFQSDTSEPTPTPDTTPDTENTYTHFGKLDSYDYKGGSAVIDGVTYQFAEEYKNSYKIFPIWSGSYSDNYIYALYSLNAENEITALKHDYGVFCKLESWDASNSIVDTDLTPIAGPNGYELGLESGDYRVSDIVKNLFPTGQIGNWIGDDILVYTDGQTIYKAIHVEHKIGTITAFDALSKPQHVYIDNIAYSIAEYSELVETIRQALFSKVAYILYDNCVVEVLSKEQLEPSLSMGLGMNASIKYKNGTYERASTSIENTLTIQITNKITYDYSISRDFLESVSDFDIKMVSMEVTSTNPAMVVFSNGSDKYIHTSPSSSKPIHAGGNYHFSIPFTFNNAHVPREGEQASFVCEFVIVGTDGETITLRKTEALTVIEVDSSSGGQNSSNSDLESMRSELEKNTAISLSPDVLRQYFTAKEIKSMERFLTVYMAQMINAPKVEEDEGFFKELTKKVRNEVKKKLYSAMNINEKTDLVGVSQLSTTVTVKGAKASVEFDIATSKYLLDGNVFSALSYVPLNEQI